MTLVSVNEIKWQEKKNDFVNHGQNEIIIINNTDINSLTRIFGRSHNVTNTVQTKLLRAKNINWTLLFEKKIANELIIY